MPSLFRFLTVVGIIAGLIYGVVFSLANFVTPKPREIGRLPSLRSPKVLALGLPRLLIVGTWNLSLSSLRVL